MTPNRVKRLAMGAFAAIVLLAGVGVGTANAQGRRVQRPHPRPPRVIVYRPYYRPYFSPFYDPFWGPRWGWGPTYTVVDPIAYEREKGYKEGRDEGKDDAKKGRPSNPTGHKDYLKSDSFTFRESFVKGYNESYQERMAKLRAAG
ncbi:MAG TPA: hypothetical protein VJ302_29920 [Blastocatellia bacterium]|nr:hypothetical protein [Blastocatellia bacterium]